MKENIHLYLMISLIFAISILECSPVYADMPGAGQNVSVPWWDANKSDTMIWTSRIPLTLSEGKSVARVNEPVTLRLYEIFGDSFDYSTINPGSLMVIDPAGAPDEAGEINGNDVSSQIEDADGNARLSSSDLLVFLTNVSARANKTYYLYYSPHAQVPKKTYPLISWNLAQNSGFEVGTSTSANNWPSLTSGYTRSSENAHTGSYCVRMTSPNILSNFGLRQIIPLSPSGSWEWIKVGGWTKAENVSGYRDFGYSIYTNTYYDPSGALYEQTPVFDTGTYDWQLYESSVVPTMPLKEIDPYIYFKGHSGTVWIDDISVYRCAYKVNIGEREDSGFQLEEPLSNHVFVYNEPVKVVALVRNGINLTGNIECVIRDPNNALIFNFSLYNDGTHGDTVPGDNHWTNGGGAISIPSSAPIGVWRLSCTGTDTHGSQHVSETRFRVVQNTSSLHPRLYFSAADLPALKAKMQQNPTSSNWNDIKKIALTFNSFPTRITDTNARWNAEEGLRHTSFYYALTGDQVVGSRGKNWLLQICAWPSWTNSESGDPCLVTYDTGGIALAVGEAYDWLYPLMTDSEREVVREAIVEKAVKPAYIDYVNGNYWDDTRTNRGAQCFGGIGVATLSIQGDDIASADPYFRATRMAMKEYLDSYDPGGAWSEGISYQSFGLCDGSGALYYLEASKRVLGENLYEHPNFKNVMNFPLYFLPPDRKSASGSFGDASFNIGYSGGAIAILSSNYRDGTAKWYSSHAPIYDYELIPEFIWYDTSIPELSPDTLPKSKLFRGVGWAALRTGWNITDMLLSLRSGPIFPGHNRPEQNSFTFDAYGERLIIEPGMPSGGYGDPTYTPYYAATVSQNTILLNGDVHSQSEETIGGDVASKPAGAITEYFSTDFYDEVIGNATYAYKGTLSKFNRHIIFIKPDYVVILDDLESSAGTLEYDSLWHSLGTNSIAVNGDNITITRNNVKLYARAFIPGFTYSIAVGQPYNMASGAIPTSYIKMYSSTPSSSAKYLYVLSPVQGAEPAPVVSKIQNNTITGVKIQKNGFTDILLFNTSGGGISAEGVITDGNTAYVRYKNGNAIQFAMQNGKKLSFNGTILYNETNVTSIAFRYPLPQSKSLITP